VGNAIAKDTLIVELEDGTVVVVKITLTKIEESGFSPLGGIMFSGKFNADISSISPEKLKEKVKDTLYTSRSSSWSSCYCSAST